MMVPNHCFSPCRRHPRVRRHRRLLAVLWQCPVWHRSKSRPGSGALPDADLKSHIPHGGNKRTRWIKRRAAAANRAGGSRGFVPWQPFDDGTYLCSIRTMYRIRAAHDVRCKPEHARYGRRIRTTWFPANPGPLPHGKSPSHQFLR